MDSVYKTYCGVDVGKWSHHFYGIDKETRRVLIDEKVPQDETEIGRALSLLGGRALIVVDQPGSMSSLLIAIARSMHVEVGFMTPMAMSKAIDMYGNAKTDAHDAMIIAEVACGIPRLIKPIDERSEERRRLAALMAYDDSLTVDVTRSCNRIHDLLLAICPPMEGHLRGKRLQSSVYLGILARYGGPSGIRRAGKSRIGKWVGSREGFGPAAVRKAEALVDVALGQSVRIPGSEDLEELLRAESSKLMGLLEARSAVAAKRESILATLPEASILMSMPGNGAITAATFIAEVGDASSFPTSAKLASYAGLSPKVRQSGTSVNSVTKPKGGNRRLKRVLVLSASKSILFSEESRRYYERKRAEGKCYKSAVTALARKRLDVMFAMLRDGTTYENR